MSDLPNLPDVPSGPIVGHLPGVGMRPIIGGVIVQRRFGPVRVGRVGLSVRTILE